MIYKKSIPFQFTPDDVKIISKSYLYRGFFSIIKYRFKHKLFHNNYWSKEIQREVFERGNGGVVLPYDPHVDKVLLIEQIRIPAIKNSVTPWLLEAISGMQEKNETLEELIRREAKEEAGILLQRYHYVLSYLSSPGGTTERIYINIGEIDTSIIKDKSLHGLKTQNEDIRIHIVDRLKAYKWVQLGIIDNAATVIAIQWLQLNHIMLKKHWLHNS
ncbi:ADP-ribose diphosphatase [Arsenophonus symbiont of Ornithomya chloropus]|uniref:ADP-ribose diphosphatase n=1 Tax=Arsenophonus symbiont of Ornithomya chloropus TaxID=634121 RepID=UPI0032B1C783